MINKSKKKKEKYERKTQDYYMAEQILFMTHEREIFVVLDSTILFAILYINHTIFGLGY